MKPLIVKHTVQIIISICTLSHCIVRALWLPPLLLEEQQILKNNAQKPDKETTVAAHTTGISKTHFLVGTDATASSLLPSSTEKHTPNSAHVIQQPYIIDGIPLNCDGHICTVLFDKFYDTLSLLIEREQKKISIAAYMLTDKRIARLLAEAHKRGVIIEVVTDLSCLREPSNKLGDLYENDIAVFICMPERKGAKSSLMHNKFILFEKNIYGRKIVWTGSANMTRSALTEIHHENVVILDDISLYQEYEKKFAQLKKRSERYEDCTITNAALHDRIRTSENSKKNTQTRAKAHTIA